MNVNILIFCPKNRIADQTQRLLIVDALGYDAEERHQKRLGDDWAIVEAYAFDNIDKVERHLNDRGLGTVLTSLEVLCEEDHHDFAKHMGIETKAIGIMLLETLKHAATQFGEADLKKADHFLSERELDVLAKRGDSN